jgi:transcriptional regulator with XRE-family HTH domain
MLKTRLRDLRETAKVSRQELADALGLKSAQTVKFWELGYRSPPDSRQRDICAYYGISMAELHSEDTAA